MLTRVINPDDTINPLGLYQAWTGVFAMYKARPFGVLALLDDTQGERARKFFQLGIGLQDGGIAIVQSQGMAYVFLGPASGLIDYATFAAVGVRAIASSLPSAWGVVLWQQYLTAIFSQIQAEIASFVPPGGRVQVAGFSQGAAMAILVGRALANMPVPYVVDSIGFGTPRPLADSFTALLTHKTARFTNGSDPVDLVPPTYLITPIGGPLTGLPTPTAWANYGTRYVIGGLNPPILTPDPVSPTQVELLELFLSDIAMHTSGNYTQAIAGQYSQSGYQGGGSGAITSYVAEQLLQDADINFFGPLLVKAPQPVPPVIQSPAQPQPTQFLIQEMIRPENIPLNQQFLIQEMTLPGFSIPPSLTLDPG